MSLARTAKSNAVFALVGSFWPTFSRFATGFVVPKILNSLLVMKRRIPFRPLIPIGFVS